MPTTFHFPSNLVTASHILLLMKTRSSFLTSGKQYHPVHFVVYVTLLHAQLLPIFLMTFRSVRVTEILKVNPTLSTILQFALPVCISRIPHLSFFPRLIISDVAVYTSYNHTAYIDLICSDSTSQTFTMNMCAYYFPILVFLHFFFFV